MTAWFSSLELKGRLSPNEPMGKHCSWQVGGVAERFFEPRDISDLETFLRHAPLDEPLTWVGLGSNLLVRDGGVGGTIIATSLALSKIARVADEVLEAEAGVPSAKIAKEAAKAGLGGCEFLAGIPGTLGGALAMNAGAFGAEIWDVVDSVETIDRHGCRRVRSRAEYRTSYRTVEGPDDEWFISAKLHLSPDPASDARDRIRELIGQRNATQPVGQASCGSVFKNPAGDFAGRLIEHVGLKGFRIGGCYISDKHANFIINDGAASATDIESLIDYVRESVLERCGVGLETEVKIIGRRSPAPESGGAQT
jgi:UDP-N-acetylmuramate dehydrogenase